MASLFNAFLSDSDSEGGSPAKAKSKASKQKPKVAPRPKLASKPSKPKPVATQATAGRKPQRKTETIAEPSEVPRQPRHSNYRGRGRRAKPGDVDRRGKRMFDRRSGTAGGGKNAKKGGGGRNNWGNELDTQFNTNVTISGEEGAKPEKADENAPAEEVKEEEPKEPEKETFTLDDFMKKKAEKRVGKAFADKKDTAVEDISEGKKYEKAEDTEFFMNFGGDKKEKKKAVVKNNKKILSDVGFRVKEPERDRGSFRGGRGRRGGFRGKDNFRGGRGGYKSRPRPSRAGVDTNDQQNFPSLGA